MANKTVWNNLGDANPLEHGGLWISKDSEEFPQCYYIVRWEPVSETQGFMSEGYVDLKDSWMELDSVGDTFDWKNCPPSEEQKAADCYEYYGAENFGGSQERITRDAMVEYLYMKEIWSADDIEEPDFNEDLDVLKRIEAGMVNPYPNEDYEDDILHDIDEDDEYCGDCGEAIEIDDDGEELCRCTAK